MSRTWALKEDGVNTTIIHWYSTNKTLADQESEKKIKNSEEIRSKPTKSRLTLEEPTGEEAEPVDEAEEVETGTDQDPESDSDEEEILDPVAKAKEGDIL